MEVCWVGELEDVGGVGIGDGLEAESFVEASCGVVFGTKADDAEGFAGFRHEGEDESGAQALAAPGFADVDAADAADLRITFEGVEVEAAYGYEEALIEMTAEDFAGTVEAVFAGFPVCCEGVDEVVALGSGFGEEEVKAGDGEPYFLDRGVHLR